MTTYVLCNDPSHDRYDQRRDDCIECSDATAPKPRLTLPHPHADTPLAVPIEPPEGEAAYTDFSPTNLSKEAPWGGVVAVHPKYPGRRRRYVAGDQVRVISADGLATVDGTPLLNSTGVVARDETQYVEVINDYDGSATPFNWGDLELIIEAKSVPRAPRKFENLAAAIAASQECPNCQKLQERLTKILEAIAGIE